MHKKRNKKILLQNSPAKTSQTHNSKNKTPNTNKKFATKQQNQQQKEKEKQTETVVINKLQFLELTMCWLNHPLSFLYKSLLEVLKIV